MGIIFNIIPIIFRFLPSKGCKSNKPRNHDAHFLVGLNKNHLYKMNTSLSIT